MIKYVVIALFIISCGTENNQNPASGLPENPDVSEEPEEAPYMQSMTLDSFQDLPDCNKKNDKQLVYVLSTETFYTCDSEWVEIEVNGIDGVNGQNGENGDDGNDGVMTSPSVWVDSFDSTEWLLGGPIASSDVACPAGYSVPTVYEAQDAYEHGLGVALASWGVSLNMWVKNINAPYAVEAYKDLSDFTTVVNSTGGSLFCYK